MAERKVLNKYYPPDYDPDKLPRLKKKKDKKITVRTMAPFNMKCNNCNEYIARATKFNARKETTPDETYKELNVHKFQIRCPRCYSQIIFKTNLKETDYEIESGATESFIALKVAARQSKDGKEADEEEEKIDPMRQLERRTKESQRQIEASELIRNMRAIDRQRASIELTKPSTSSDSLELDIRLEAKELLKRKNSHKLLQQEKCTKKSKVIGSGW